MSFRALSTELKINILQYLDDGQRCKFATVSKEWKELCRAPALRDDIVVDARVNSLEDMAEILIQSHRGRTVCFENIRAWGWLNMLPLFSKRYHVNTIDFMYSNIGSAEISRIVSLFPFVKTLCITDTNSFDDGCLSHLSRWKMLKSVIIYISPDVNTDGVLYDIGFARVAENCHHLREFDTVFGCSVTQSSCLRLLTLRGENLTSLGLKCDLLTDTTYRSLRYCYNLIVLYLHDIFEMTDVGLQTLSELHQLKSLCITNGIALTDSGFVNLFNRASFSKLRDVDFRYCVNLGDDGVSSMAKRCPYLSKIDISHCINVSLTTGVAAIKRNCKDLKDFSTLGLIL